MSDQSLEDMGGTQRLGDYECQLNPGHMLIVFMEKK